jgi:hypothetical protein
MSNEINFNNRHGINIQYDDTLQLSCRRDQQTIIRVSFETYEDFRRYFNNRKFEDIGFDDIISEAEKSEHGEVVSARCLAVV